MRYSVRVLYAAVRAEVLAYRPRLERAVLEAIRLAQRNARRIHYAKQPFDESKHPRAPAGRPEGGEFVRAGGAGASSAPAKQTDVVRTAPQSWAAKYRDAFNELPTRSTAELQARLKFHTDFLVDRFPSDLRASHRIWVDRIQELLAERDYSDQNAPLAAKERIWAAQKKYLTLAVERVRLEKWLASAKRRYASKDLLRNIREVQDALHRIKTQMEKLALITGARLPQDNPIRDWSFEQKFSRAAEIALQSGKLAPEVAAELRAAIQPANLVRMGAMMAALAAAHAYPLAGLAADAVLLTYVGVDGALTGHRIYLEISSIQNEADLNAAADVLRKELASQASGKLVDLLTWGTGKGAAAFNKRYKVTIDHNQVRRLSTGEMPLTPNPKKLIPLKVVKKTPAQNSTDTSSKSSKSSRKKSEISYVTDPKTGLTIEAVGKITGTHPGRKKGMLPEPQGGRMPGEHRGHLIPEGGVRDPSKVNVQKNLISESPQSNLRLKKSFDIKASKLADAFPTKIVHTRHRPLRHSGETRPYAVEHWIEVNGKKVYGVTIFNP